MRNNLYNIVFLGLFLISQFAFAQSESSQPLPLILEDLQNRYGVQFNYASSLVENIVLEAPESALSLEDALQNISQQTKLAFIPLSEHIISIRKAELFICGILKDVLSGEPLPYVTVQSGSRATISNEEGYFELKNPGDSIITIQHIAYKPLTVDIATNAHRDCQEISLVPFQEKLQEVVVYDFLVRGIDKLGKGTIRLDFERFSILPGLVEDDVLLSIQALPGIQSVDETVSNITIRGGSNDQNLISWDGIKMYQSGHFFGLISMYNPLITQKVDLRKNGSSASATDGVSGTIAMRTNDYLNDRLHGSLGVNLIDANGFMDVPLGPKASLQIAARKAISNYFNTPTYSKYFERIAQDTELEQVTDSERASDIEFDFYDTSFRLLYQPTPSDRFRINFIHTSNEVLFDENAQQSGSEETRKSNLDQSSTAAGVLYSREWSETFNSEISVYNTDYHLNSTNANIPANQRFIQENKVSETGAQLMVRNSLTKWILWSNGYDFVETKVTNLDDVDDPLYVLLTGEVLHTHSVHSELGFNSKDTATELNLGLRFNYLDDFNKQIWEPRLSFNHSFWKVMNLEILGEYKHQATSQVINFQNDFLGIEKRRWQLSNNQSIPVIQSKQASVGLSFNNSGWLVSAVTFYKEVEGVTSQSQGFQDRYEFVRTSGSYDAKGVDLLIRKKFKDNSLWCSYSYLDSQYYFDLLAEEQFPNNFDITNALSLGGNYTLGQWLLAAGINWRTGKPYTRPIPGNEVVNGEINYGDTNGQQLATYMRVDVSSHFNFKIGNRTKARFGISFWNVLDRDNTINSYFRPISQQQSQEFQQSSLGITPNATFRVIFN